MKCDYEGREDRKDKAGKPGDVAMMGGNRWLASTA
jgi:hypothetical protein